MLAAERRVAEPPPSPVVVWDPIGGPIGVGVAELLATHGAAVTLVTPDHVLGEQLARRGDLAPRTSACSSEESSSCVAASSERSDRRGATVEHRFSGERRLIEASLCVDAGYPAAGGHPLAGVGRPPVPRAGDAVAPRTIHEAILEGRRRRPCARALPGALAGAVAPR